MPVDGELLADAPGGQTAFAAASAASPSYLEGALVPLSVSLTGSLRAGIDQSTPGTTNGVVSGASHIATNQIPVDTTAGGKLIVASRAGRDSVTIENLGTVDVFVGPSGVTTANGHLLPGVKGGSVTIAGGAAVYGIVASGTQTVSYVETY